MTADRIAAKTDKKAVEYNRIYNCDCVDGLRRLSDECIDLVVTSPPYDNMRRTYHKEYNAPALVSELHRTLRQGGVAVWVCADQVIDGSETGTSFRMALNFIGAGFKLYDTMIWEKPSPSSPTEGRYYDVFEYMFVFSKGKPKTLNLIADRKNATAGSFANKETRSCKEDRRAIGRRVVKEFSRRFNVWRIAQANNKTPHPAVFPLSLALDHILSWSNEGDLVCDPFMGSGTTAVAAMKSNRHFIGYEINKEYCDIANKRIEQNRDLFTTI